MSGEQKDKPDSQPIIYKAQHLHDWEFNTPSCICWRKQGMDDCDFHILLAELESLNKKLKPLLKRKKELMSKKKQYYIKKTE